MRSVKVALLVGFALLALALVSTVSRSPISVAASNKEPEKEATVANTSHGATYCQTGEALPAGTSAIRVWLDAAAGPRVKLTISAQGHTITSASRGSDWIGSSVTVPVRQVTHTVTDTTVCVSFPLHYETVLATGSSTPAGLAAHEGRRALTGRLWIEYLRPGSRSWLELVPEVVRHMGFGHAIPGTWIVYVALVLVLAAAAVASRVLVAELR